VKKKETHSFTRRHQIFYKKKRKTDIKKEKEGGKKKKTEQIGLDWIQNKTKKTFKFSKAAQFHCNAKYLRIDLYYGISDG